MDRVNQYRPIVCDFLPEFAKEDIIDAQVWIQHNSTEILLEQELIQRGVLAQDIILGLRSPSVRKHLAALQNNQ